MSETVEEKKIKQGGTAGRGVPSADSSKGLEEVLAHAQGETRQQLQEAIEKKRTTGQNLKDILRQNVDREMFKRIWAFLERPAEQKPGETSQRGAKKVKDVLVEGGWMTSDDLVSSAKDTEECDPEVARALIENGHLTEDQFNDALAEHERSGLSVWRILVNRGLLLPKQIADARKYRAQKQSLMTQEADFPQMLLRTGLVTEEQCRRAVEERKATGRDLLQILIDSGLVTKAALGAAMSKEFGVPYVDLRHTRIEPEALALLPEQICEQNRMIPIALSGDGVTMAMVHPGDDGARELFRMMVGKEAVPVLAFEKDVLDALKSEHARAHMPSVPALSASPLDRLKARLHDAAGATKEMVSMAENAGVVDLVSSIIEGGINSRATDIHLEPQSFGLRVRYRIDGMLYDVMTMPTKLEPEIISRVKVLANMDITERRHPQDGHCSIEVGDKSYDLRAATLPTVRGEKMVLRLLRPDDLFLGLRELGLEPEEAHTLESAIARPYGMILVTGPIASGKTSTLYAALSEIDIFTRNVVTIEEPVEYKLPGINQVEVDHRVDRTFANMLRAVLRQDADVMMVGEIRDEDTAHVAVRAAMTGHMVFSTLHANDSAGAIDALRHLGIPPYLIASSLLTVVAQRLVRRLCPCCRERHEPADTLLSAVGLTPAAAREMTFYRAVGCKECYRTGFKGRTGIFEVLSVDDAMKSLILAGASRGEIVQGARDKGMLTMMESGIKKVRAGITTLEELLRVTSL